jgi:uncharacterized protein (DUF362 family)
MRKISRRDFLKFGGAAGVAALLWNTGCQPAPEEATAPAPVPDQPTRSPTEILPGPPASTQIVEGETTPAQPEPSPTLAAGQNYMAVVHGADPEAMTKAALEAIGGIERFVKSGQTVVIKPNICVAYHKPEYAATTNPIVVGTLVSLCLGAGAKWVRVMDMPFGGTPKEAYAISGIEEAVKAAGGEMVVMSSTKYEEYAIPQGRDLTSVKIFRDIMEADVLVNVPIAKHHSLARLTLGGKNLLGMINNPTLIHRNFGQRIADLASLIRPELTVVDAFRILMDHGPTGGSLNDVYEAHTLIASHDMVATDAYATTLFRMTGKDIDYVRTSAEMGLGTLDLGSVKVEDITL